MRNLLDNDAWTQRYETLRRHFLDESGRLPSAPLGLLLFLRQGLAGWMRAWNPEPLPSAQPPSLPARLAAPGGWQRELTSLLAHLTSLHLQPTAA